MKKVLLSLVVISIGWTLQAQTQITNSDFEEWEEVIGDGLEPINWNSFLTSSGLLSTFASNQIEQSSDIRPGSEGTKSVKLWSKKILGITANGNLTLGRINMGSSNPLDPTNFNMTVTGDPLFNQVMTDKPDSLVVWVKFTPNGHSQNAKIKATIHDNYDYRDPEDEESQNHIVGIAELSYPSTEGTWQRKSIPFYYDGPANDAAFILITFATNETAGGGAKDDFVWIDDLKLIYNPLSVKKEGQLDVVSAYPNPVNDKLTLKNIQHTTSFTISSVLGKVVATGNLSKNANQIDFSAFKKGVYFIKLQQENNIRTLRIIKD